MIMKSILPGLLICFAVGCSTPRTKYTDPVMRVMVDPDSIDKLNLPRVQKALIESGKWKVVDRSDAYKAMNKEQERQYKDSENRIEDKERYAIWGKQYGVGGIVVAKSQCAPSKRFMSGQQDFDCLQSLQVVDAMTGEVISMVDHLATDAVFFYGEIRSAPSWNDVVDKLNTAFPSHFKTESKSATLLMRESEAQGKSNEMRMPSTQGEAE